MQKEDHSQLNDVTLDVQRYHLGLMTPDEEVAFEHGVKKNPELRKELLETAVALTTLYENLSGSMPAPRKQLKVKLLQTIAGVVRDPSQYEVDEFVLQAGSAEWVQTIIPGVELQLLYIDDDGRAMMKARLAPGTVYPPHERFATEECLVLSGDFWADDQKLTAGDFIAGRTGNEPLPLRSEGGCELLLKIPIPYQIMPKAPNQD